MLQQEINDRTGKVCLSDDKEPGEGHIYLCIQGSKKSNSNISPGSKTYLGFLLQV